MVARGEFAEWAEVHGNLYGTSLREIDLAQAAHRGVLFDIDYQGARQIKAMLPEAVAVFILPPSMAELERRLRGRATEDEETVAAPPQQRPVEIEHYGFFDYVIDERRPRPRIASSRARLRRARPARAARANRRAKLLGSRKVSIVMARPPWASSAAAASTRSTGMAAVEARYVDDAVRRAERRRHSRAMGDTTLLFLPRHGRGHRSRRRDINYRANVCALKKLGATHLVSVSAVGSMKEEIAPGDLVVVDQFIDLTKQRARDVLRRRRRRPRGFADPVCPLLAEAVAATRRETDGRARPPRRHLRVHRGPAVLDARREPRSTALGRRRSSA